MRKVIIGLVIMLVIIAGIVFVNKSNIEEPTKKIINKVEEDKEIFEDYYESAKQKLSELTLDEKIGQVLLVRLPDKDAATELKEYKFGGYLLFGKDFKNKTEEQVKNEIKELQENANLPLLIAVDEEGGTVVRVSSNSKLVPEKFASPSELYKEGGFEKIKEDTINKSNVLINLGVNLNLAPVVDVSTNPSDYMYKRALGEDANLTSEYAKTVIEASKDLGVSYTLKHFPGYGNNVDTHVGSSVDNRTYEDILSNDLLPFKSGIEAGAEAVLISHNTVTSIDSENPASLSPKIHEILRKDLNFSGVIITDDLSMGAVLNDKSANVKAIQAGNDFLIVTDYNQAITDIKNGIENGDISEDDINNMALKVISWKYYKNLL